jgi:NDP-sugar pyrophosphorylase family protein
MCGVVLAAGRGTRLRTLATGRPKASFPIGQASLLERAVDTLRPYVDDLAINSCGFDDWFRAAIPGDVRQFDESPAPLGTAGALVNMRGWIRDRDVAVLNVDSVLFGDVAAFLAGPSNHPTRLLVTLDRHRPDFHRTWRFAGLSTMTADSIGRLAVTAEDLYHDLWKHQLGAAEIALVPFAGVAVDCGTPLDLLAANLILSSGATFVEAGARVDGHVESCVVLRGAEIPASDTAINCIVGPHGRFGLT